MSDPRQDEYEDSEAARYDAEKAQYDAEVELRESIRASLSLPHPLKSYSEVWGEPNPSEIAREKARADRLAAAIEKAPHAEECHVAFWTEEELSHADRCTKVMGAPPCPGCDCWKKEALK